ncbi:hypothetical protein DVA67_031885 [Solirubrobacter sp. CPCC 204708]|uniref:DUF2530 domain-containing protein n=1 Tax=Solirubrobacter deserti TaxID=2282478 RepID=A0ABT4RQ18_9ACTN|nr:hypothetical protein [Solirubrobacter deserti]MBE2320604.1 hypothetical protein [Solirubrobacter deserti]MDA0140659.1 hypothetical protein [Solirubrobacter deserti]
MPRDHSDPYADVSTTPLWDFAVGMSLLVLIIGGGLAAVYAIGYFVTGQPELAWPLCGTFSVLLAAHLLFRHGRRGARRHG